MWQCDSCLGRDLCYRSIVTEKLIYPHGAEILDQYHCDTICSFDLLKQLYSIHLHFCYSVLLEMSVIVYVLCIDTAQCTVHNVHCTFVIHITQCVMCITKYKCTNV